MLDFIQIYSSSWALAHLWPLGTSQEWVAASLDSSCSAVSYFDNFLGARYRVARVLVENLDRMIAKFQLHNVSYVVSRRPIPFRTGPSHG
jgi:hypothetical protein